jgi:hypothetical protein
MAGLGSIFGKVLSGGADLGGGARTAFGLRFDVKKWFFDRDRVTKYMDRKNRQALQEAGRRIRRAAQTSMRYVTSRREQERKVAAGLRKRAARDPSVSRPGEPPRAIKPHPWIRRHLFYAFEPVAQSVVIGPVGFPRGSGAPETLEFGGRARVRNKQRRRRRLGGGVATAEPHGGKRPCHSPSVSRESDPGGARHLPSPRKSKVSL